MFLRLYMHYRVKNQLSFSPCISAGNPFRSRMIERLSDARDVPLLPPPSDITDKSILRRMFRAAAAGAYELERNENEYRRVRVLRKLHGKKGSEQTNERTTRQRWGVCIRRLSASNDEEMKFLASYSDVRDIWRYDRRMNFIFRLATL